jgi:cell shape-determining protein MreC
MQPVALVAAWFQTSPAIIPTYFRDRSALEDRIRELERQVADQSVANLTITRLVEENTTLRGFHGEGQAPRLLARVVGRPPFLPYDLIQLDKGSGEGVAVGAPVFVGRDVVIGSISHVTPQHAFVRLVSTPSVLTTVYLPDTGIAATMEGYGGGVARVRVPQGIRVATGHQVISLAYDAGIFGTVAMVESIPQEPEQYAYVTLPTSLQSLRYVTIGIPPVAPATPEELASSTRALLDSFLYNPEVGGLLDATTTATTTPSEADLATTTPATTIPTSTPSL